MNTFNPYPIYNVVNKKCLNNGPVRGKWFELTPHEAGFTDLGLFINTSHVGSSNYDEGPEGKETERDMTQMQGLVGSVNTALSKMENMKKSLDGAEVPSCISGEEHLQLIDGGLMMNMPFPPFLGEKRDADLLIALDSGSSQTFETLTEARDYAKAMKKPFPEIDDRIFEEKDWPEDCYVFEGKEKEPTIVYIPLFNRHNCKDVEEVQAKMKEFSTFQLPLNQERIEFMLETAKANIRNNKDTLLMEIYKASRRRHKKM
ncbi:hypothetical protein F7725_002807 [Dissostichus mawsoni]|uniref:PLA2c domain-containing protein n=1 Tax=Dissostichus mawsoni TaxID=36200 RepID=A0A7J5YAD3_DISMA|nr:hypothetical protein F7725_002807 [Dissostichus mawsoni]